MLCRNKEVWPNTHTHQTADEARRCWMGGTPAHLAPPSPASTPLPPTPPTYVRMSTERQWNYIHDLGGDAVHAAKLTYDEASDYIVRLKAERKNKPVDPRLDMIGSMLDMVPDGYYATAPQGEGGHVDFLRFTHVTKSTRRIPAGTLKIQTQHSEQWMEALLRWPGGNWSVYKQSAIEMVMLVIADYKTCARRYAIEVQACMRCNKQLTDDRSRHYLVGPECETKHGFTWPIDYADEQNDGLSFEQLVARGKPTRVWQDRLAV